MTQAELNELAGQGEYGEYSMDSGCSDYACPCHHKLPILVAEVRRLTPAWTATLPTEPGPWWFRPSKDCPPRVVTVQNMARPNGPFWPGVFFPGEDGEEWMSAEQVVNRWPNCVWAGPLVPPG